MGGSSSQTPKLPPTRKNLWAPPGVWSPWYHLLNHGGSISRKIEIEAIGKTMIKGKVRYWKYNPAKTVQVEEEFMEEIVIKTAADVWGKIEISLKGVIKGSACYVTIS